MNKAYRDAVARAQTWERANDYKAAVTAWLVAVEACPRYDQTNRELCGERAMRAFNAAYIEPLEITEAQGAVTRKFLGDRGVPVALPGTSLDVFYWPGARDGEGKRGRTRGAAYMMCGTPVIGIEGVAGAIALSHVLVVSDAGTAL